eukprot:comp44013_c0_seq1/m.47491 comp44013_c0_seq1/g.47491  ORF comp44013_c0_seq1/g.47491 comp44013_c0_seq1/m.47491 type:complete len:343 (-) comp44013_c0_seq1:422-1450(-)
MSVATQNPVDPNDRYWCHSCDQEVVVDMNQYACSECHGGFIEQIGEDFLEMRREEEEQERQAQQQAQQAQAQQGPFNPFQQLDREQEQPFAVHRDPDDPLSFMVRSMLGHVQAQPQAPAPAPAQAQPYWLPPGGARPRQPGGRPAMVLPGDIFAAMSMPIGPGGPMPEGMALFGGTVPGFPMPRGGAGMVEDPFANRLTGLIEMLTGLGGMGAMGVPMFGVPGGLPGDIRDYAWGPEGLDHIITRLMDQMQGGAPPAPSHVIENLPDMVVTEEYLGGDKKECAVCMDAWGAGEVGKKLPCDHLFHNDCIVPWLKAHGTCPVCRLKLYEQQGQQQEAGPRRAR